jgi:hypothetical protein
MKKVLASKTLGQVTQDIVVRSGILEALLSGITADRLLQDFVYHSGKFVRKSEEN